MSKVTVVILFLVLSFRLWQTSGCRDFTSFNFNPLSVTLRSTADVNSDNDIQRNVSRFFHNKINEGIFVLGQDYASLFEPRLILEILGPLGFFMMGIALYNVFRNKKIVGLIHLSIIASLAFLMLLNLYQKSVFYFYILSLMSFTFWGFKDLQKLKYSLLMVLFLAVASFWYFSFTWQLSRFCSQIFFN